MNMASEDIKDMLLSESSLGFTFGTNLFIGRVPTTPDNCVAVFDAGGRPSDKALDGGRYHRDSVSIQVRNVDYVTGYVLAESIESFLISKSQSVWDGVLYTAITSESGVLSDNWDGNENNLFLLTFTIQRVVETDLLTLTMSTSDGGIIEPESGVTTHTKGTVIPLKAIANAGYVFTKWVMNGYDILTDLTYVTLTTDITVSAVFTSLGGILTTQVKIFDSTPVLKGNRYYFGDHSTKDNDVLVKNIRVGTFSQTAYVNTNMYILGQTPINFKISYEPANVALTKYLLVSKTGLAGSKGILVNITNLWALNVTISNGTLQQTLIICDLQSLVQHDIEVEWNGLAGGTVTVTVNGIIYTFTALYEWVGNSATLATVGTTVASCEGKLSYAKLLNGANYFEYVFNHGQEAEITNLLDETRNGTLTGAVLATFWGSTSDNAIAYDTVIGATLYQNDSDSTIMPVSMDTSRVRSGFTRLGYYPPNSGILRGVPNKYNIPVSVPGMPAGDYNEAEIRALVASANIIKTETENTINLLEGKVLE